MDLFGILITTIGSIAACIAAYPIIVSFLPMRLSDTEKNILKLSLSNESYPGIIQYYISPLGGRAKPHVNSPYLDTHLEVKFEMLELRDKGLIQVMDGASSGRNNAIWYQVTSKGYKVAKRLA